MRWPKTPHRNTQQNFESCSFLATYASSKILAPFWEHFAIFRNHQVEHDRCSWFALTSLYFSWQATSHGCCIFVWSPLSLTVCQVFPGCKIRSTFHTIKRLIAVCEAWCQFQTSAQLCCIFQPSCAPPLTKPCEPCGVVCRAMAAQCATKTRARSRASRRSFSGGSAKRCVLVASSAKNSFSN